VRMLATFSAVAIHLVAISSLSLGPLPQAFKENPMDAPIATAKENPTDRSRWDALPETTVGPRDAEIVGSTHAAIQLGIDAMAQRGGGTVRVLPGEYVCIDSVRLRPNVRLLGERDRVILRYGPLVWSPLAVDADKAQTEITPKDATGFRVGMGICTYDAKSSWLHTSSPRTITAIRDGVLYFKEFLGADRLAEQGGRVVSWFPLVLAIEADGAEVDGLTADGTIADPEGILQGIRTATVNVWHSRGVTLRNVVSRHGVGDGICFSTASTDGLIEHCEAADNGYYGIHPGSHSTRIIVRHCDIHGNAFDGLYVCWGIRNSEFTDNHIWKNGWTGFRSGLCIGHKDTDNLIARNHIHDNAKYGIAFREKTMANAAHRCVVRDNVIENNGSRPDQLREVKNRIEAWESVGAGIAVCGMTQDVVIENNTIRETRSGDERTQRHAVILRPGVSGIRMSGNTLSGHPGKPVLDESGGKNRLQE